MGYDFDRGRLDTTVHPFEVSMTRNDVRITSRWRPDYLPMALFGTLHETGHALYEQGIDPAFTRGVHATDLRLLYAVGGTSFGMHESQSRLIENHVGRSAAFWDRHFGTLRDAFPDQLGDVTVEEWLAAIRHAQPGLTRVESDELTYDLHIMLRVRIEMALMDGSLKAAITTAATVQPSTRCAATKAERSTRKATTPPTAKHAARHEIRTARGEVGAAVRVTSSTDPYGTDHGDDGRRCHHDGE